MPRLLNKNVLITGASSGIGEAIAIRFAAEGANVAINYNSGADRAKGVLKQCLEASASVDGAKRNHITVKANIANEDEIKQMFAKTLETFGNLDILINNSGIQAPFPSEQLEAAEFDRILNVNLRGAFLCSREAIRHFLTRGRGVIVNNSSVHEIIPKPKYLPYSISKGGLENMTKSLALEYADRNIRVNSCAPGAIVTPINNAWINDPKARGEVESHIPMGRPGTAEEIAGVFLFLASEESSYVTGQTLFACGGLTLYPEFRIAWSSGE